MYWVRYCAVLVQRTAREVGAKSPRTISMTSVFFWSRYQDLRPSELDIEKVCTSAPRYVHAVTVASPHASYKPNHSQPLPLPPTE